MTAVMPVLAVLSTMLVASSLAFGQPSPPVANLAPNLAPAEIQRLFDAFVLVQAQESLTLTDDQFGPFVSRLKRLQDVRRRNEQGARRLLRAAQRLASQPNASDELLQGELDTLDDHQQAAGESERAASAELDQILTPNQRVRFRVFEQRMERRKLELVMRAGRTRPAPAPQRRQRPDPRR